MKENAPFYSTQRIGSLDSLRGLAILGILLINITSFGLPEASWSDPTMLENKGLNFYFWYIFGHGVFEGSFRALFSMLFGASFLIIVSQLEKRMGGLAATEYFVRRQLWLLFFGLINAFILLWPGDILYHYAICGIVLLAFRSASPRNLIIASTVCLILLTIRQNKDFLAEKKPVMEGIEASLIDTSVTQLTWAQKDAIKKMEEVEKSSNPEIRKKKLDKQNGTFRNGYRHIYEFQSNKSISSQTYGLYYFDFFDVLIFMLIGMAFFKSGIMQGEASLKLYGWFAFIGLSVGLCLSYLYLHPTIKYKFDSFEILRHKQFDIYELQRYVRSMGIFGTIMVAYKLQWFKRIFEWLRPVGRMAFTNYLSQSVICAILFYGFGLGLFGRLERYELYVVVLAIWITQIAFSHIWLRFFHYGPLEWLWRSLTVWKLQPTLKNLTSHPPVN
jgi:uncharacterized protein